MESGKKLYLTVTIDEALFCILSFKNGLVTCSSHYFSDANKERVPSSTEKQLTDLFSKASTYM